MKFDAFIPQLLDDLLQAWNNAEMDKFADLLEDHIQLTTPGLVFSNVAIEPQVLKGKEEVMIFVKKTRAELPLRSTISNLREQAGKKIDFKVQYYEIDVWSSYDCFISQYGKLQELTITRLENTEGKKISTIYVLKNILKYRLKNLFGK